MSIVLALDIDDTITASPAFFSLLTRAVRQAGGRVHVVSTRHDVAEVWRITEELLAGHGIAYDELHLIADMDEAQEICPHKDLNEYQRWVWQKVDYCVRIKADVYFDDDEEVVGLFRRLAPHIQVFKTIKEIG